MNAPDPYGKLDSQPKRRTDPRLVTRADHERIQARIWPKGEPQGEEDYAVTLSQGKGFWVKSIHVFQRQPMLSEIDVYEQTASRVKFKGQKAEIEGSQIQAAVGLYNRLVTRTYDVLSGMRTFPELDREQSMSRVPALMKREAIRQLIGEVYSASRMEEALGSGDETETSSDDDAERHTSEEQEV